MPDATMHIRRRSRTALFVTAVLAILTAFLGMLVVTYLWNNRPPSLAIPTPAMPPVNAYDDFLRAARMAGAIPHQSPASMVTPPTTRAGLLAATRACTKDAAPALAVMRRGFDKPCLLPPARTYAAVIPRFYAQFRELERTVLGVEEYYELTGRPGKAADAALDGAEFAVMF